MVLSKGFEIFFMIDGVCRTIIHSNKHSEEIHEAWMRDTLGHARTRHLIEYKGLRCDAC